MYRKLSLCGVTKLVKLKLKLFFEMVYHEHTKITIKNKLSSKKKFSSHEEYLSDTAEPSFICLLKSHKMSNVQTQLVSFQVSEKYLMSVPTL